MPSQSSILLAGAVVAAALFAALRKEPAPVATDTRAGAESFAHPSDERGDDVLPPDHPPIGATTAPSDDVLPPDHPPVGAATAPSNDVAPPQEGLASVVWKAPPRWSVLPNASKMRLVTYRIPAAAGVTGDAELSVVRAGGSVDANLDRWVAQFTDAEPAKRTKRTVNGLAVSLLEVSGTFMDGGAAMTGAKVSRRAWMLSGAVVETTGGTYFFKLTGPAASVRAARADFESLVSSLSPAPATRAPL